MGQIINLQQLNVQVITDSSGVFCGRNLQVGWHSINKTNHGYGVISGDKNAIPGNLNWVHDADLVDSSITLKQAEAPSQNTDVFTDLP